MGSQKILQAKWAVNFVKKACVAMLSCSLDYLILCLHFYYGMQKMNFWKANLKRVNERAKWVNGKSKIGRFIEHKRKPNGQKKRDFVKAYWWVLPGMGI